jgi:L-2-hydroxyglutarate oxidase LhgO
MSDVDALVVGAGVVGLACALSLARRGHQVMIAEEASCFGSGVSSRNSEVIHAGLYYPVGSLKARLCLQGRDLLYSFCEQRNVPHRRLGKLIFAHAEEDLPALERIAARADAVGARELRWLSASEVSRIEPALDSVAALHSPMTGIIDSHALMLAMLTEIEALGGQLVCRTPITAARRGQDGWDIWTDDSREPALSARVLVNAAGLGAQQIAKGIEGLGSEHIPEQLLVRGCYFGYSGKVPFEHLIYPVPVPGGLGTHLTFDLAGQARFGPNVEPIQQIDYSVDPARHVEFATAAKRIWSGLDPELLYPAYAGIRPKVPAPPNGEPDFIISGPGVHGLPGLALLFGIESPGLTASLAIGEEVCAVLGLNDET